MAHRTAPALYRTTTPASVSITFDDGPDPRFTPGVLDVLASHGAVATFFLVGRSVLRHPELVHRIVSEGHEVGSHTFSHPHLGRLGPVAQLRELWRGRRALEQVLGREVRTFRPPAGYYDARVALATWATGMRPWLWNTDPEDWRPGATSAQILASLSSLRAGDVILLHDGLEQAWAPEALDRTPTVDCLADLIALARERGLEPRALAA